MNRDFRLTKTTDFQRVRRLGKSYAHPLVVLVVLPNQNEITRFGISAGRAVGKAVVRNRAKRLLRAAVQFFLPQIHPGWDVVLIARRRMTGASFDQTQAALYSLFQRANLLLKPQEPYDL